VTASSIVEGDTIYTTTVNSGTRTTNNSWDFEIRATIGSAQGKGTKIPLFGTLKSTLTFNVGVSQKNSKSESNQYNGKGWSITSDRSDFSVMPRISYSFSNNINGGLNARWQDSNDKTRYQKTHLRDLGIWVEIRF